MTTREYKQIQSHKLINEFKKNYYEKIGLTPIVTVVKNVPYIKIIENPSKKPIDLDILENIINSFLPTYKIGNGIIVKSIKHKTRLRVVVELRHIFCYIAKSMGYNLISIGKYLNDRDHTTVINSITKFKNLFDTNDEGFMEKYEIISEKLNDYLNGNELLQPVDEESVESKSALSTVLL